MADDGRDADYESPASLLRYPRLSEVLPWAKLTLSEAVRACHVARSMLLRRDPMPPLGRDTWGGISCVSSLLWPAWRLPRVPPTREGALRWC